MAGCKMLFLNFVSKKKYKILCCILSVIETEFLLWQTERTKILKKEMPSNALNALSH